MQSAPREHPPFNQHQLDRVGGVVQRLLGGAPGVGSLDADDLVNEIAIHVLRALPMFNDDGPASIDTWIDAVVRNKFRDNGESERALKRGGGKTSASLDELGAESGTSLHDLIEDSTADTEVLVFSTELRRDIQAFAATLPESLRETLLVLYSAATPREAARSLGIAPGPFTVG